MSTFSKQLNYSIPSTANLRSISDADFISSSVYIAGYPGTKRNLTDDAGSIYVYNAAANFTQIAQILSPLGETNGGYGLSVAASSSVGGLNGFSNFVFVGEPFRAAPALANGTYGRVYCYGTNTISSISNSDNYQTITCPNAAVRAGTRFGVSISLSAFGTKCYMLIGELSNGLTGGSFRDGAVYMYQVAGDGKTFNYLSTLSLPTATSDDQKGNEVLVFDNMLIVAANKAVGPSSEVQAGQVYYYTYTPSTGAVGGRITLPRNFADVDAYDWFGNSIACDMGVLAVGAPSSTDNGAPAPSNAGKVFLYRKNNTTQQFVFQTKLTPPASFAGFSINTSRLYFGHWVGVVKDATNPNIVNILVGAPGLYNGMLRRGAVFVYRYNLATNTATLNNMITLTPAELDANPGNRLGYRLLAVAKNNPDYTVIHSSFDKFDTVPTGAFSNTAYIYNGQDFLNTDNPVLYTSGVAIAPGPYLQGPLGNSFFPPGVLNAQFGDVVSLSAGKFSGNPDLRFDWIKDGVYAGTGDQLNIGSVIFSNAGTYRLSASNLIGAGLATNSSGTIYELTLAVQGTPAAGSNRIMPYSGSLSIAGELAPIYRSINQFIKNYNGIGLNSSSSLTQREMDVMYPGAYTGSSVTPANGAKPATGVAGEGSFSGLSYISVLSGELEMNRSFNIAVDGGSITGSNFISNKPGGSFTPARMSEFYGAYKWYSPFFTAVYRSNSGWPGGPAGPGPNKGTITVTGVNNMVSSNYFVQLRSSGGSANKSLNVWYLGAPTVTYEDVGNEPDKTYTVYLMDSNGYGWNRNVTELQSTITATYP